MEIFIKNNANIRIDTEYERSVSKPTIGGYVKLSALQHSLHNVRVGYGYPRKGLARRESSKGGITREKIDMETWEFVKELEEFCKKYNLMPPQIELDPAFNRVQVVGKPDRDEYSYHSIRVRMIAKFKRD